MHDRSLHLRFDAGTHPDPEARAEAWREAMSLSVDVAFQPGEMEAFEGRLDFHSLGSVLLVEATATAHTVIRDATTIARTGDAHVIVDAFLSGGFVGTVGRRALAVGPGDGFVMDLRGTMRVRLADSRFVGAIIPRGAFEARVERAKSVHGRRFQAGSPEADLLCPLLESFLLQAPRMSAARGAELGLGLVGLIGACLGGRRGRAEGHGPAAAEASRARVRRHIERHAADPGLDPDSLGATFGLSRTALYRLFQPEGGVAEAIRHRRAEIAHRFLTDPRRASLSIETVARVSGFGDARSLNRALRELHGASPTQLRAAAIEGAAADLEVRVQLGALFDALDP